MAKPLPQIEESAAEGRALIPQARNPNACPRLHALYGMASEQASNCSAVASLLGVHRATIGAWCALYAEGRRERLRARGGTPGQASRVPPTVLPALVKRRPAEAGCAAEGDIQTWLAAPHGWRGRMPLYPRWVGTDRRPAPELCACGRSTKPGTEAAFTAEVAEPIRAAVPPDCALPVAIHGQDEARVSVKTTQHRRITARGGKPLGACQPAYTNTWRYGRLLRPVAMPAR